MTCGIYKIYNTVENKCYIGKSLNIEGRWSAHKNLLRNGKHHSKKMQLDFDKYGMNSFEFRIIKVVDDPLWLDYYESYYAEKYNAFNEGYNTAKLHKSQDIKFVLDNMEQLENEWVKTLDFVTYILKKSKWTRLVDPQIISNKLGITEEQVPIFISYFEHEEYKCEMSFDNVSIAYFSKEYMDSLMENFYL